MTYDFHSYNQQMNYYLQRLEKKISSLEQSIAKLNSEIATLKSTPPIHIDRIEYSFDQLKVETLDGTLNIGISPGDLQKIEELAVNPNGMKPHPSMDPKNILQHNMEIEEQMNHYIQTELPPIIRQTQNELGLKEDESYIPFIQEDVTKQLPTRIHYYLSQHRNPDTRTNVVENVIQSLQAEIQNGVQIFLRNIPENMKGRKPE